MDNEMDKNGVQWKKMEQSDILMGHPDVGGRGEIGQMDDLDKTQ